LTARTVTYFQNEERALAERDVVITNSERRMVLTCGQAEYLRHQEYSRATITPVLIEYDSVQTEKLRITGAVIEMFEGGERDKVSGQVDITRENTRAQCDTAEYFRTEGRLQLRVNPVTWQNRDELRGELIELFLQDQQLTHAQVTGKAVMTSPVDSTGKDPRVNSLSGGKMTLHFQNEKLEHVVVEETATSVYHVLDKGENQGVNEVQGDRITLFIDGGELHRILIASDPGVSNGKYEPAGAAAHSPSGTPQP
jgi:lipopolysaccharide export system protein LptA